MGEQDVVVVGQEANGHLGFRRRTRCPRQVEELDPVLVAEDLQTRAQALECRPKRQA